MRSVDHGATEIEGWNVTKAPGNICSRQYLGRMDATTEQRIAKIHDTFVGRGWRLRLGEDEEGTWEALYFHGEIGATIGHAVHGPTALDAAEGALRKWRSTPSQGGTSA